MARPAYKKDQITAKEQLKKSFWKLLSENKYSRITVKMLSSEAGVNPNTFYYHYDTMDSLALDALNDEKLSEIPTAIRSTILKDSHLSFDSALEYIALNDRWGKIRLFINSDSAELRKYFYDTMEMFWLSLIGVAKSELSQSDYLDLTFILHGAISIINLQTEQYNLDFLKSILERPLGQGIMQTLAHLMLKYQLSISSNPTTG